MRKRLMIVLGICLWCLGDLPSLIASPSSVDSYAQIGSAGELRNQDMAFALLLEVYREYEGARIQGQYERRIVAVDSLPQKPTHIRSISVDGLVIEDRSPAMLALRAFVQSLVEQERNLEISGLQSRMKDFSFVYNTVRRQDETRFGRAVPCQLDTEAAAERLRGMVAFVGGSILDGRGGKPRVVAVDEVLRRAPMKPMAPGLVPPVWRGPSQELNPARPDVQRIKTPTSTPPQRKTIASEPDVAPGDKNAGVAPDHQGDVGVIIGLIGF